MAAPARGVTRRSLLVAAAAGACAVGMGGLAGCGVAAVPGAYLGRGSVRVDPGTATPAEPATMFSVESGRIALAARGAGVGGSAGGAADDGSFFFQEIRGDGAWICRIAAQPALREDGGWGMAGLMARASGAPGAANAAVLCTTGNGVVFQWRPAAGQPEAQWPMAIAIGVGAPVSVRLARAGNLFTVSYALSGSHFVNPESTSVVFDPSGADGPYLVGLFATSHDTHHMTLDLFTDVQGFRPNQFLAIGYSAGRP